MRGGRYWNRQFAKFEKNKGRFVPTWSWTALIFGWFWLMWKGLWGKAFLLFVGLCLLNHASVSGLLFWLYPAMFGKWDFYLLKKQGTHFW